MRIADNNASDDRLGAILKICAGFRDQSTFFNDMHEFDFQTKTWSKVDAQGDAPSPRFFHSAVLYNDAIYIIGGRELIDANLSHLEDFFRFDLG